MIDRIGSDSCWKRKNAAERYIREIILSQNIISIVQRYLTGVSETTRAGFHLISFLPGTIFCGYSFYVQQIKVFCIYVILCPQKVLDFLKRIFIYMIII